MKNLLFFINIYKIVENYALLRMYFIWLNEESYSTYICTSHSVWRITSSHMYLTSHCGEPYLITHVPHITLWWAIPHHTCTSHHTVVSHTSSHMYLTSHCGEPYLITHVPHITLWWAIPHHMYLTSHCGEPCLITHVPHITLWWAIPHHTCTSHHTVVSHASSHMYLTSHCGEPCLITCK